MTTTGTAGAGFRVEPLPCVWQPAPADPGERVRCGNCGRERAVHLIPQPRSEHGAMTEGAGRG